MFVIIVVLCVVRQTTQEVLGDVVTTKLGRVEGVRFTVDNCSLTAFLGVPYAEPPLGDLRFARPKPVQPWSDTISAKEFKSSCLQPDLKTKSGTFFLGNDTAEDCLYANIWVPECAKSETAKLPVLVYIYGGMFVWGDTKIPFYDGSKLAATSRVIVITFNYRLGPFGMLNASTSNAHGNQGLYDQVEALKWVQQNIDSFGGDPNEVTLMGQSIGSMSVGYHLISPLSTGLFKKVIMCSGTAQSLAMTENLSPIEYVYKLSLQLNCISDTAGLFVDQAVEAVECLKKVEGRTLLDTLHNELGYFALFLMPGWGDDFLPDNPLAAKPKRLNAREIFIGNTVAEGSFFIQEIANRVPGFDRFLQDDFAYTAIRLLMRQVLGIGVGDSSRIANNYFENATETEHGKRAVTMVSDAIFNCPTEVFVDEVLQERATVFRYIFDTKSSYGRFLSKDPEATHGEDVPFFMNAVDFYKTLPYQLKRPMVEMDQASAQDEQFGSDIAKVIGEFIRTG